MKLHGMLKQSVNLRRGMRQCVRCSKIKKISMFPSDVKKKNNEDDGYKYNYNFNTKNENNRIEKLCCLTCKQCIDEMLPGDREYSFKTLLLTD